MSIGLLQSKVNREKDKIRKKVHASPALNRSLEFRIFEKRVNIEAVIY